MSKDLRDIKVLMYDCPRPWVTPFNKQEDIEFAKRHVDTRISKLNFYKNILAKRLKIYKLAEKLKMTDDEMNKLWLEITLKQHRNKFIHKQKPKQERRDNKDVLVGSGNSWGNTVRYPSKKRSLSTWKKFYKLFPRLAEADGFDGKTSSKMTKK
jgi:hypothetical protein